MKSFTTTDFWRAFAELSLDVKEQAQKAYQLWQENSLHPSLHFKKLGKNLWSVRVSSGYRALALKKDNDYYWFWIGAQDEYETLLKYKIQVLKHRDLFLMQTQKDYEFAKNCGAIQEIFAPLSKKGKGRIGKGKIFG